MKKAIVIIPTYNEAENLPTVLPLLESIFIKIKNWQMNILIVDDSSPDGTADVVREFQKKYKNLFLLVNKQKAGLGTAYLKGMDEAFHTLGADVVFEFDADLSHDPERLPAFIEKLDEGYDMVLGSRYIPGGGIPSNWGLHRKFLSVFGNLFIVFVLTDFRIRDWTGGYRAITKKVYEAVKDKLTSQRFSGYTFQIGFLYNAVQQGFRITEVPFHFVDRKYGKSKMGADYLKTILLYVLKIRMENILQNRIFKFIVTGGVGAAVQFITLRLWRAIFPYQLAFFLGIECAVVSNFVINNAWTFSDRKLKLNQWPAKFIQFNIASSGSILIQQGIALAGEKFIGTEILLFTVPVIHFRIDTGMMFAIVGIIIGMFWNFFAYNAFIWRKTKEHTEVAPVPAKNE